METAAEINAEVARRVQDSAFILDDTVRYINKGLKEIAGTLLLPKLLTTETTVDTVVDTAYADLPDNFMQNLHYCYSNNYNRKIRIYDSLELLYSSFTTLDLGGRVVGVARRGERLYYQRIPASAETLRIHYYKYPTEITASTGEPDCLPEFLVRPLLVNYVCKEIFELIEDGMEGPTPNTDRYEKKFGIAMAQLNAHIGPEARVPKEAANDLDLEGYL